MNGVVAHCRCWREVGWNGNDYGCSKQCPGANGQQSGTNVCGGFYEYSKAEATAGMVREWGLEEQEKRGFGPGMYEGAFAAEMEVEQKYERGDCQKAPMRYPGSRTLNPQINQCSMQGEKKWYGTKQMSKMGECEAEQSSGTETKKSKGIKVEGQSGEVCVPVENLWEDQLVIWKGAEMLAFYYDQRQPLDTIVGLDTSGGLNTTVHGVESDYTVHGFEFRRTGTFPDGECTVVRDSADRKVKSWPSTVFLADVKAIRSWYDYAQKLNPKDEVQTCKDLARRRRQRTGTRAEVLGIDSESKRIRRWTGGEDWEDVEDSKTGFKQITMGMGEVYGISGRKLYHTEENPVQWEKVDWPKGTVLKQISVNTQGDLFGVDQKDTIYANMKDGQGGWMQKKLPGALKQVAAYEGDSLVGVNSKNDIYL